MKIKNKDKTEPQHVQNTTHRTEKFFLTESLMGTDKIYLYTYKSMDIIFKDSPLYPEMRVNRH